MAPAQRVKSACTSAQSHQFSHLQNPMAPEQRVRACTSAQSDQFSHLQNPMTLHKESNQPAHLLSLIDFPTYRIPWPLNKESDQPEHLLSLINFPTYRI